MDWKDLFNYGSPTVMLAFVAYATWKIAGWMRTKVVEPIVKSHIELIDTLRLHLPRQSDSIDIQTVELKKQTALLQSHPELFTKVLENQSKIIDLVKQREGSKGG